jgi:hypothetical protein
MQPKILPWIPEHIFRHTSKISKASLIYIIVDRTVVIHPFQVDKFLPL